MKLVTFENAARQSRIGAMIDRDRIVDLSVAWAAHQRAVEGETNSERAAAALVPTDMRALFGGGDASLDAARKALDYVARLDSAALNTAGARAETLVYSCSDVQLQAPIIPKKFFHTAGNFREHHEEATKAGFSHPVMPWIVFFRIRTPSLATARQ